MRLPRGFRKVKRKRRDGSIRVLIEARAYKYDGGGRRKRFSVYGRTVDEAKAKIRKLLDRNIASFEAEKETLGGFLDRWLSVIESTRQTRTHELYEAIVRNHIKPYISAVRLSQLRSTDIRHLLTHSLQKIGSRTRQLAYRVLHYALSQAVEDEVISVNPCLRKDKPRHTGGEYTSLTRAEAQKLLEAAAEGDYYVLFYLALATGMREGEIFGLQWTAIDFESGSLYVRGTLTKGKNNETILGTPKASRRRRIDLGPRLTVLLQEQKRRQYPLGPWVFTDKVGRLLEKDRFVRTVFHPLLEKAGIRRIRFHDLRHTSATLGIAAGENVKVVAERLGHSSAKLTLDVYAKALPTLQRDAAARMDAILANDGGTKGGTPSTKEG